MNTTTLIPDIRKWPFAKEIRNFSTPVFPVRHSGSFAVLKGFPDPEQLLESTYDTVKRYLGQLDIPNRKRREITGSKPVMLLRSFLNPGSWIFQLKAA